MRKKSGGGEGGNWMDTYGDMVTLLLCFFVLLYAISAIDQTKWANLVRSLNPDSVKELESLDPSSKETLQSIEVPEDFETLYENLKKEVEKNNLNNSIEVKKGEGFTFITFKDNVCFGPNSYVLQDEARVLLDSFCVILQNYSDQIGQIQILGHTAEANPGHPGNMVNDRFLSSNRAAAVLVYLQEKDFIDPVKLISIGYGQYRPIADNNTEEGRSANRRVEMLITKTDAVMKSLDEYYKEIY